MSEMLLLPIFIYLTDSIVSSFYAMNFLKEKYRKGVTLAVWATVWFLLEIVVFEILGGRFPVGKLQG